MTDKEKSDWVKQMIDQTIQSERQHQHDLVQKRVHVLLQRAKERREST